MYIIHYFEVRIEIYLCLTLVEPELGRYLNNFKKELKTAFKYRNSFTFVDRLSRCSFKHGVNKLFKQVTGWRVIFAIFVIMSVSQWK